MPQGVRHLQHGRNARSAPEQELLSPQSPVLAPGHPQGATAGAGGTAPDVQEDQSPQSSAAHHSPVNGLEQALFSPWDLAPRA